MDGLVQGKRWLSEGAVTTALEPHSKMAYASRVPHTRVHDGQMWQVYVGTERQDEGKMLMFGHSGSDGTYAWVWPEERLSVLYFTQSRGQRTWLLLEQRFGRLFSD